MNVVLSYDKDSVYHIIVFGIMFYCCLDLLVVSLVLRSVVIQTINTVLGFIIVIFLYLNQYIYFAVG